MRMLFKSLSVTILLFSRYIYITMYQLEIGGINKTKFKKMCMRQTLVPIYNTNEFYRSFAVIAWWVWSFLILRKQLLLYNVIFIKKSICMMIMVSNISSLSKNLLNITKYFGNTFWKPFNAKFSKFRILWKLE